MNEQERLLEQAISGDREAAAQLLEKFAPAVRARLAGLIPERWQSMLSIDDVLQQTYMEAFLDIGHLEDQGEGSFAAWICTLAQRNLHDALRMLKAEKRGGDRGRVELAVGDDSFTALYELVGGTTSTPSRQAARAEAGRAVQAALHGLPRLQRQVVRMYDLEGRSMAEVAKALGRSPGAMYMLRARAHEKLRLLLGTASKYLSR